MGGALKDTTTHVRDSHKDKRQDEADHLQMEAERRRRLDLIKRGAWHDGRLDCVAGNGVMSELGLGEEPTFENDLYSAKLSPPLMDDNAPIAGEGVPPTSESLPVIANPEATFDIDKTSTDIDEEAEFIKTLPIVVLQNFAQKAGKGDV